MSKTPEAIDTVWKAAAYGDFEVLTRLTGEDPSLLHAPDGQGFYALQWAALNNRAAVLGYLLSSGCDVAAVDGSGQTALHWAAVRGASAAADALLRAGADLGARDGRGYTPVHVAAQYGQAGLLRAWALRWGADLDARDGDSRTPLHWAAYKGHSDCVRLLALAGCDVARPDAERCTPLHWAAIRGHAEACTLLVQAGAGGCLGQADDTGATPSQLAAEKGHRMLGLRLAAERESHERKAAAAAASSSGTCTHRFTGWRCRGAGAHATLCTRLAGLHLAPVVWAIVLGMLTALALRVTGAPSLPPPGPAVLLGTWLAFACAVTGLYYLARTTGADPGFLPCFAPGRGGGARGPGLSGSHVPGTGKPGTPGLPDAGIRILAGAGGVLVDKQGMLLPGDKPGAGIPSDKPGAKRGGGQTLASPSPPPDALCGLDSPALAAGQWTQICVACRIVRPLRAKHCGVTGRCVEVFDHYCPWVGNVIGRGNRAVFLTFLWLELAAIVAAMVVAVVRLHTAVTVSNSRLAGTRSTAALLGWPVGFIVANTFLLLSVAALALAQANQVARNVTTNELANWHRYRYLRGEDGEFHNPFDQGWRTNCADTCLDARREPAVYVLGQADAESAPLMSTPAGSGGKLNAMD